MCECCGCDCKLCATPIIKDLTFMEAMLHFWEGKKIRRASWPGYRNPLVKENSMCSVLSRDMLAQDWMVVPHPYYDRMH
jgi:hypothetical protein